MGWIERTWCEISRIPVFPVSPADEMRELIGQVVQIANTPGGGEKDAP